MIVHIWNAYDLVVLAVQAVTLPASNAGWPVYMVCEMIGSVVVVVPTTASFQCRSVVYIHGPFLQGSFVAAVRCCHMDVPLSPFGA